MSFATPRASSLVLALALTGCAAERAFVFPDEAATRAALAHVEPNRASTLPRLALADIVVHFALPQMQRSAAVLADTAHARTQLERYLRARLAGAPGFTWVERRRDADYVVEVDTTVEDAGRANGWFALGIGLEILTLGVGAGAGAAIGEASARAPLMGSLIGLGASIPISIALALAPPGFHYSGTLESRITLRRQRDGVEVDARRMRTEWSVDAGAFSGVPTVIAEHSGSSGSQLATALIRALRQAIDDLGPLPSEAPPSAAPGPAVELPETAISPGAN